MIYLLYGEDSQRKLSAYEKLAVAAKDAEVFKLNRNDFDPSQTESFYSGAGLFSKKFFVVFSDFLGYAETREFLLQKLPEMQNSGNTFVFLEGKLNKPIVDAFKSSGAKTEVFELAKPGTEKFNSFLLANAFGAKDKLGLWIYFRQAADLGVALEELSGVLFWKAKDMIMKKNFAKFSERELRSFAQELSYLLPEARSKNQDAEATFERFLLEAF